MQRWCEIYADESGRLAIEFWKLRHGAPRLRMRHLSVETFPQVQIGGLNMQTPLMSSTVSLICVSPGISSMRVVS